jgi:hypothetical protein
MVMRRREGKLETVPLREELEAFVHSYHHLQNEHHRASPESSIRRRIEGDLLDVRERLDRVLEEWIPEEELRNEWRAYIDNREPEPERPGSIEPLVFEGRSEVSGSIVEIRGSPDDLRVEVDGSLVERVVAAKDFSVTTPPARFRLNDNVFEEIFSASPDALDALASFLDGDGPPPWDYASELLADGLIDTHFDLTPRGRRALALRA